MHKIQEIIMKDSVIEESEKGITEVPSVATDVMPQQISNALNALLDSRPDGIERIDLEAEPITTWRFKITLMPKSN